MPLPELVESQLFSLRLNNCRLDPMCASRRWPRGAGRVLSVEELRRMRAHARRHLGARPQRPAAPAAPAASMPSATRNLPLEGCFLAAVKACGEDALALPASPQAAHWEHRCAGTTASPRWSSWAAAPRDTPQIHAARDELSDPRRMSAHPQGHPGDLAVARTLLDLAAILEHKALRRAVREAQAQRAGRSRRARAPTAPAAGRPARAGDAAADHRHRPGADRERARGRRPRSPAGGRDRPPGRQRPDLHRRAPGRARLPLAASSGWSSRPTARAYHDNQLAREDDAERQALLEAQASVCFA